MRHHGQVKIEPEPTASPPEPTRPEIILPTEFRNVVLTGNPSASNSLHTLFCPRRIRTIVDCLVASTVSSAAAQFPNAAWHTTLDCRAIVMAGLLGGLALLGTAIGEPASDWIA